MEPWHAGAAAYQAAWVRLPARLLSALQALGVATPAHVAGLTDGSEEDGRQLIQELLKDYGNEEKDAAYVPFCALRTAATAWAAGRASALAAAPPEALIGEQLAAR